MRKKRGRRLLALLSAGLLFACIAALGVSALANRGLPTHSQVVDRLPELEKARAAEALHLRAELGEAIWPGFGRADVPLLLYNEANSFLLGYPDPAGWAPVNGDAFDGRPYYWQPNRDPQAFAVDVNGRWVGSMSTQEYARIYLVEQVRRDLPGPLAAVFPYRLAMPLYSTDWHIAAIIHESFHAFQAQTAREHFDAANASQKRCAPRYPWGDEALRQSWQVELDLLADALQAETDEEAAALARQFVAQRAERRARHGLTAELADYERRREWQEGLAKYVELEAWRRAGTTPGYEPRPELAADADFKGYAAFRQRWSSEVTRLRRVAGEEGDGRFYYTGMAQAVLLDRLAPGWKARTMAEGLSPEELLAEALGRG